MEILTRLWDHSLSGGLSVLHGKPAGLNDCFRIRAIRPLEGTPSTATPPDGFTLLERYWFAAFRTDHLRMHQRFDWPSLGLLITDRSSGATVTYSGDTRFDRNGLGRLMAAAKLNFHEVQLEPGCELVHTLLDELRTLPEETRRKTYLYHYDDTWDSGAYDSVAQDFAGFADPQHRYVLFA